MNANGRAMERIDQALSRSSPTHEQAVLGAMMLAKGELKHVPGEIRELLRPADEATPGAGEHHFTLPAHKLIWSTIVSLMDRSLPHEAMNIIAEVPPDKLALLNNGTYLLECQRACGTPASGTTYAQDLAAATLLRQIGEIGVVGTQLATGTALADAERALTTLQARVGALQLPGSHSNMVGWDTMGPEALDEVERLAQIAENPALGQSEFSTEWIDLNRILGPVAPGSVIVIAGRPGLGKSTVGSEIARHLGMDKRLLCPMFSLEMSRSEVALNMLAAGARVRRNDIKHGACSDEDWVRMAKYLAETEGAPFYADDTPKVGNSYVDRELATLTRQHGKPPVAYIVDHLGLQAGDGRHSRDRQVEVQEISKGHKELAKRHNTIAILLAQLNRGPEQRADKRPMLSDLRESGSIEQDADIVILLYREDYYDKESPEAGIIELNVAKNRHGPTGVVQLAAQLHLARIRSMAA